MSSIELESKITKMQEWEALAEEAKAEADTLRDAIKAELLKRDTDELQAGRFIVRWSTVLTSRLDTTALKKAMPEIYKAYTKQTTSRRFSVA